MLGESPIGILAVGLRGDLEVRYADGIPHMGIAAATPMNITGVW